MQSECLPTWPHVQQYWYGLSSGWKW